MKFRMSKSVLAKAVQRASAVTTKGVKSDYEYAFRIAMDVKDDEIEFSSTNGHLQFTWSVDKKKDDNLEISEKGRYVVEADVVNKVVSALGGSSDILIDVYYDNSKVYFKDASSNRKRLASIATISEFDTFSIATPRKSMVSHEFPVADFTYAISRVSPHVSPAGYRVQYAQICLDFIKDDEGDKIRYVCGDGTRFAVMTFPQTTPLDIPESKQMVMPAEQAEIICKAVGKDATTLKMVYKDEHTCYLSTDDGAEMLLKGIPDVKYIAYEKHAFRFDDAKTIVDMEADEYIKACKVIGAVRDKEVEKQTFHSSLFTAENDEVNFKVDEGKFRADYSCEASIFEVTDKSFKSHYSYKFLDEVGRAMPKSYLRFYCVSEKGTIIVEPVNYKIENDSIISDERGIPEIEAADGEPDIVFFFAAVKDKKSS